MTKESPLHEPLPPEKGCFPVTKDIVEHTFAAIAENPEDVFSKQSTAMLVENRFLLAHVLLFWGDAQNTQSETSAYTHGAIWTYSMLGAQAGARGTKLPKVTLATLDRYEENVLTRMSPGQSFATFMNQEFMLMKVVEPELARGIQAIAEAYDQNGVIVRGAAAFVYGAFRAQIKR